MFFDYLLLFNIKIISPPSTAITRVPPPIHNMTEPMSPDDPPDCVLPVIVLAGVFVAVGAGVGVGVDVTVGTAVGIGVDVGSGFSVGFGVGLDVGAGVAVGFGVGVAV